MTGPEAATTIPAANRYFFHISATATYRQARDLSRETYEAGTTTFLDLLDAERSAGTTALALALSIRGLANDWTALQVATGRGWATRPAAHVAAN